MRGYCAVLQPQRRYNPVSRIIFPIHTSKYRFISFSNVYPAHSHVSRSVSNSYLKGISEARFEELVFLERSKVCFRIHCQSPIYDRFSMKLSLLDVTPAYILTRISFQFKLIYEGGGEAAPTRLKLFVCGPAEAGKTTLVHGLAAATQAPVAAPPPVVDKRTLGVDVTPLTLGDGCHFSVWDFAGEHKQSTEKSVFLSSVSETPQGQDTSSPYLYHFPFSSRLQASPSSMLRTSSSSPMMPLFSSSW